MIAFINTFFPTLAAWVLSILSRKATIFLVSLTAFASATAVFLTAINFFVSQLLTSSAVPSWVDYSIGLFIPYSFNFDLSILLGAYSARWAYDIILAKIELINSAV